MIVFGHTGNHLLPPGAVPNELLARWAGERLGIADFGPCITIGVVHNGGIVAVALYNKYLHPNIEVTFVTAAPQWASPGAVRTILSYPFVQLSCKRVTATTESANHRARRFLLRLGFRQEGYHPDALPSGDAVTYGLTRADAERWLRKSEDHGKATARAAA